MNRREFVSSLVASAAAPLLASNVKRVLVVFKCHLDIGFVDTQAAILRRYYDTFYPQAIKLAEAMRASGADHYVWTTGSWMLYTYLEQASPAQRKTMEHAISGGDIAWHALPFTWQTELMDRSLISGCIGFSKSLDQRFGRKTTGAKMTDVPGHTRGLLGPLAEAGVTFLDIGVNSASTPPNVPDLFVWKDVDGKQVTVMYHRKEYGGVVTVPGSDLAVAVEMRDDNTGPNTLEEARTIYADLRTQFPGAEIHAANLTEIANALQPYQSNLPVLTQEVGDTWIHGVASDPTKLSRYRELQRLRVEWIKAGNVVPGDKQDLAFLERFSLAVEHTWGTDTKTWLDSNHYTPHDLAEMLGDAKYKTVTGSWVEKRQDIDQGVARLAPELRSQAENRLASLTPKQPDLAGLHQVNPGETVQLGQTRLQFDPTTGAITHLEQNGRNIASADHPLALLTYQTLSKADYDRFLAEYITLQADWAPKDFGKPNIESFGAKSQLWNPSTAKVWASSDRVVVELAFGSQPADSITAWPEKAFLTITDGLNINLSWFNKRANRMPEAFWLSFQPVVSNPRDWQLWKTDRPVSPLDVVTGGNRHFHAVIGPIKHKDGFSIESLDAAVVSLGVMSPVSYSTGQPDLTKPFHYSLFNNGWGTNYVQWFGEDAQFRFRIQG